jgi:putative ABC transport system ATP-binding protein
MLGAPRRRDRIEEASIGVGALASTASVSPALAQAAEVLAIDDLAHSYGARAVVEIPSWTVAPGQHSLILGASGSGKSTLLHLIAGLLRPSRGRLLVAGRDLGALTPAELDGFRGRTIGIVLQRLHLIRALTVRDNLRLARTLARLPADPARIDGLISDLGLHDLAEARPNRLSEGEAQRVAIARAVVNQPVLILADEPTSALDDANCATVLTLLRSQAQGSGATLMIATHDARLKAHFTHTLELPDRL